VFALDRGERLRYSVRNAGYTVDFPSPSMPAIPYCGFPDRQRSQKLGNPHIAHHLVGAAAPWPF
jgi:hypothetical protein